MASARKDMMTTSTEPVVLKVGGMTCAACADTVRQAIRRACPKATADHFDIVVNLLSNEVCVSVPEHVLIDPYVLKQAIENAGFECRLPPANDQQSDDEEDVEIRGELQTWRRRLMVCALLGIPEIVVCMILMPLLPELHQQLACLEFFVVTALQWSVGLRYAQKAFNNLRLGVLTMDLLVSLASFTCYLSTVLTALQWNYFESASTLLLFVTFGKYLECLARKRTRQHLRRLGKSLRRITEAAQILADGTVIVVKVDDLRVRDAVQVKPGEYVPTDGLVLRGSTTCEEALLTGEPKPVFKDAGSVVFAGTLNNGSGVLTVEVTQPASQSTLAHVLRAVQATSQKARLQRLADRVARLFIPAVLMLSILTFIVWALLIWIGLAKEVTIGDAVGFAVAVLTVACPCALGLAVPTALLVGKGVAARHGLLIKDDEALLAVARCDRPTIIFDKTGTLTKGTLKVCQFVLLEHAPTNKNNATSRQILRDVYWLERHCSEHVIAASLCDYYVAQCRDAMFGEGEDEGGEELGNVQVHPGKGIEGTIQDRRHYLIGSARLLQNVPMTAELQGHLADLEQCGMLCVLVACNGQLVAYFALSDEFKDDAVASVRTLRNEGYGVEMLTGDQWTAARWIAEPLGIRQVYANCSPSAKQHLISRRQCDNASLQHSTTKTNVIVFVGDGINDGPALAQADLGIALGRETSAVAQSAAHVVCLGAPVSQIRAVLHLGCAIRRTIAMSFGWSLGYNALALPLAAGLFYPWRIGPTLSGLLMSLSSVSVVLNALTLNLWYPPPDPNINQADADKRVHDEAERESLV